MLLEPLVANFLPPNITGNTSFPVRFPGGAAAAAVTGTRCSQGGSKSLIITVYNMVYGMYMHFYT